MHNLKILCCKDALAIDVKYYVLFNISRSYAFKSDLKIKWIRPEKIPCYKPEKSGDLENVPNVDKRNLLQNFNASQEIKTANEIVKKLFTLEFAPKKYTKKYIVHGLVDKVKRHEFDIGSAEVKIAKWTGTIRALQDVMEMFPRNKKLKVNLKELIDQRKKHLKYLRQWDYKKFEWLLENLNILYKPVPSKVERVTRKDSLQKLTKTYCDDIKEERLSAYKLQLNCEQDSFLQEKLNALQFIRNEEKECGVEVTVTQQEIDEIRDQLKS